VEPLLRPGVSRNGAAVSHNEYGSLIEGWKVAMIGRRARMLGFREDDIPDLEQQIVMDLLGFEYDPTRGSSEANAVITIIDRALFNVLRDRNRDVRRVNAEARSFEVMTERTFFECIHGNDADVRLDLEGAMAGLSASEREMCTALLRGESQADIAQARGCTRAAVSNALQKVREALRERGIGGYADERSQSGRGRKRGARRAGRRKPK
jgi:DNA-directed RNA polymerase specialized sigma24 family protein